ncbi:hypothetical protein BDQ17DRAFT_1203121, partial [Cyathus striatus]
PGVLDSEGYAICPECGIRLNCQHVGISNLTLNHMGKKTCIDNRSKHDKGAKIKKNASLLNFFTKPKAMLVPSTVTHPAIADNPSIPIDVTVRALPVLSKAEIPSTKSIIHPAFVDKPSGGHGNLYDNDFLSWFCSAIANLPETVPEATPYDPLTAFSGNPADYDDAELDGDGLWETMLNKHLKSVFGSGNDECMDGFIRHGQHGLGGLANFVQLFV